MPLYFFLFFIFLSILFYLTGEIRILKSIWWIPKIFTAADNFTRYTISRSGERSGNNHQELLTRYVQNVLFGFRTTWFSIFQIICYSFFFTIILIIYYVDIGSSKKKRLKKKSSKYLLNYIKTYKDLRERRLEIT